MSEMPIESIMKILPHRYPFIMVDRVREIKSGSDPNSRAGTEIVAVKNVTINEPYFVGHFPHRPVMPGVLQIEAMAQAGGIACYQPHHKGEYDLLIASMQKAKFRKPVVPGDELVLQAKVLKDRPIKNGSRMVVIDCCAKVKEEVVSEVEILAYIQPREIEVE